MGRKKTRRSQNGAHRQGAEELPTPSLAGRLIRPVVTVAAPGYSYYLDLADIALGREPALRRHKKGDR